MDWFDRLLEETKDASEGDWFITITHEGYNNISSNDNGKIVEICGDQGILLDGGPIDNANALLMANAVKMRDEIIRLRKIINGHPEINTHSSLDEK